ncbi:probable glutamate receptor [Ctenocephalides felis]|uniref:probable glutamate receptor n=1 Tax=Ctenocephalides felis TaxID=7515 RepID=UPI000E6E553A|nr:probable glutamate receptor [Ctenocephalides felis]
MIGDVITSLNGTRNYHVVKSWGYKDPKTGKYDGLIGELISGDADFGTPIFFVEERIPLIEFITVLTPTQARFVFRAPPLSYVSNLYLLPFNRGVWIACGVLILSMTIALSVSSNYEHEVLSYKFFNSLLVSVGAVCQQGPSTEPKNPAGRIVSLFLFVTVMFLYTSYTANIVSLLQSRTSSIKTIKDLLHSPMKMGSDDTQYFRYFFMNNKDPVRRKLYEKKIAPKNKKSNWMNVEEGIAKMREGLFAFHVERSKGYKVVSETFYEDEKCGLIEIDYLAFLDPYVPIQKRSPYKEMIKNRMLKLREIGIQSRETSRHYSKKPVCSTSGANFVSVGLIDCYFGGVLMCGGVAVSICLFVIEMMISKICSKNIVTQHPVNPVTSNKDQEDINEFDTTEKIEYLD